MKLVGYTEMPIEIKKENNNPLFGCKWVVYKISKNGRKDTFGGGDTRKDALERAKTLFEQGYGQVQRTKVKLI